MRFFSKLRGFIHSNVIYDSSKFCLIPSNCWYLQGVNREAMATALARAEMRGNAPSAQVVARAVRSLRKKLARIAELENMRDSGENLTPDQVCFLVKFWVAYLVVV